MTKRLNRQDRSGLRDAMLRHAFADEDRRFRDEEHALADAVLQDRLQFLLSEGQRRLLSSLPKGWLPRGDNIQAQTPNTFVRLQFPEEREIPRRVLPPGGSVTLPASDLATRIETWSDWDDDLRRRRRDLRQELEGILATFSSTKQLHERWPEAAAFLPDDGERSAGQLMAPTAELNQRLGLA